MKYYGFDEGKAVLAIEKYREYFSSKGIFENAVYPAIPELLEKLANSGKKLLVATSKPTQYARRIVDFFNLNRYFYFVSGSNLDGSRTRKSEVIEFALKECRLEASENVVMIGDRKHDIIGAKELGIDSIGVSYGYGSRHELENENPTHIADNVADLRKILLPIHIQRLNQNFSSAFFAQ